MPCIITFHWPDWLGSCLHDFCPYGPMKGKKQRQCYQEYCDVSLDKILPFLCGSCSVSQSGWLRNSILFSPSTPKSQTLSRSGILEIPKSFESVSPCNCFNFSQGVNGSPAAPLCRSVGRALCASDRPALPRRPVRRRFHHGPERYEDIERLADEPAPAQVE